MQDHMHQQHRVCLAGTGALAGHLGHGVTAQVTGQGASDYFLLYPVLHGG